MTRPLSAIEKGPPGLHQRPLNMGQRSDVPLPEVAFMPIVGITDRLGSVADLPNGIVRPLN